MKHITEDMFCKVLGIFLFLSAVVGLFYFVSASGGDTMIVEVNVLNGTGSSGNGTIIRVEVPDYLFFGNVSKGSKSDELTVYVNNTGNVDITVTPHLTNASEEIFSYLYFRKTKTKTINGTTYDVNFTRIGEFGFNITKPSGGNTFNEAYFYVTLNLINYNKTVNSNIMGHRANVRFIAVQR